MAIYLSITIWWWQWAVRETSHIRKIPYWNNALLVITKMMRRKKEKWNYTNANFFNFFKNLRDDIQTHRVTYSLKTVPYDERQFMKCCEMEYFNRHWLDVTTAIRKKSLDYGRKLFLGCSCDLFDIRRPCARHPAVNLCFAVVKFNVKCRQGGGERQKKNKH